MRITFAGLGKRFGPVRVFKGLDGEVRPGQVLVISGRNGAGKSTLLHLLAGLMRPTAGSVTYFMGDCPVPRQRWHTLLGMASPDMAVYEELTALENLRFFARLRGLAPAAGELEALLESLGLAPTDLRRPVRTFSSGMRQRVKLAQAVVHRPPVLLLDEPSSNLDEPGHQLVASLVAAHRAAGAVALATNDPRELAWGDAHLHLAH